MTNIRIFFLKKIGIRMAEIENTFGVIENQQASPIPALVEKITNSIDAVLMKGCLQHSIDPKSVEKAPKSMAEAVDRFFPDNKNWDLPIFRQKQAKDIQILADGPKGDTSLIIYDNGEGQHPEDFEDTLLSLLKGNKNDIRFVQGKYNMGGSGALVFCGKNRYQLVASKKYDGTGLFGFTLIRRHPLTSNEELSKKNTWYEYLKIDGEIPSFDCADLELNLYDRKFNTGTIIKLYSYDLPAGSRSVISRDLNLSLNEYLFEPALPIYTIDKKERYPADQNLQRDLYGLKRRLEQVKKKYIEDQASVEISDGKIGTMKVSFFLFKSTIEKKSIKESKNTIRREFFSNKMSVLFSLNGQVHGHYTSEFITRSLKYPLFKDYLLIHVDCTDLKRKIRDNLFMGSRDRMKSGEESRQIRAKLSNALRKSALNDWYKQRKNSISVSSGDSNDLLKSFARNLPLNSDLMKLLNQSFKLTETKPKPGNSSGGKNNKNKKDEKEFNPKRFPSYLRLNKGNDGETPVAQIPLGGERTLKFLTDVEDEYLDRIEEPGELKVELLNFDNNESDGGDRPGIPGKIEDVFNVVKTSPNNGTIRIALNPKSHVQVGEAIQVKVTLSGAGEAFEEIFFVRIRGKEKPTESSKPKADEQPLGLPECVKVYKEEREDCKTWEDMKTAGIDMDFDIVMHPYAEGEKLKEVYINMDSSIFKKNRSKLKGGSEQLEIAEKKYVSAVYFHTLFLYTITKNRNYNFTQGEENEQRDLSEYLKDLFQSHYAEFLLNFGTEQLIESLE